MKRDTGPNRPTSRYDDADEIAEERIALFIDVAAWLLAAGGLAWICFYGVPLIYRAVML